MIIDRESLREKKLPAAAAPESGGRPSRLKCGQPSTHLDASRVRLPAAAAAAAAGARGARQPPAQGASISWPQFNLKFPQARDPRAGRTKTLSQPGFPPPSQRGGRE